MAKKAEITVTDHEDVGVCTSSYSLRLRETGATSWSTIPPQYESPIVLYNLKDDISYDLEVTRHCCDNGAGPTTSTPAVYTFTSTNT